MQFALALLADAVAAAEQAQPDEAINLTLLVEKTLEGADSAEARDARAAARLVRAGQLRVLGEVKEAEATYRSVIADCTGDPEVELRYRVTAAYANVIQLRAGFGTVDEAASLAAELVALRGADREQSIRELVALEREGIVLRYLEAGRDEEAIAAAEQLVAALAESNVAADRLHVARALTNGGLALRRLGREAEVLPTFQKVIARYGAETGAVETNPPELNALVVRVIAECALIAAARDAEGALFITDSALDTYRVADETDGSAELAGELLRLRVLRARFLGGSGRREDALAAYDEVIAECAGAPDELRRALAELAARDRAFFAG